MYVWKHISFIILSLLSKSQTRFLLSLSLFLCRFFLSLSLNFLSFYPFLYLLISLFFKTFPRDWMLSRPAKWAGQQWVLPFFHYLSVSLLASVCFYICFYISICLFMHVCLSVCLSFFLSFSFFLSLSLFQTHTLFPRDRMTSRPARWAGRRWVWANASWLFSAGSTPSWLSSFSWQFHFWGVHNSGCSVKNTL